MIAASEATLRTLRACVIALTIAAVCCLLATAVGVLWQAQTDAGLAQALMHSPCSRPPTP